MTARPQEAALSRVPPRLHRLCDDASMFPPGNLPIEESLRAHVAHSRSDYRRLLGPLVVEADLLDELDRLSADLPPRSVWLAVTVPSPAHLADAMRRAEAIRAVRLAGAEVALPPELDPGQVVPGIAAGLHQAGVEDIEIYVEVPRGERRPAVLDALAASDFDAKFFTGGVTADLHPDDAELADTVLGAVSRHLPFKATAGLHHAIRNTDPHTGFEQHGFLNLMLAVDVARQGVGTDGDGLRDQVTATLADRDGASIAARIRALSPERAVAVRSSFTSFGTCSILEPLDELVELGLVDREGAP